MTTLIAALLALSIVHGKSSAKWIKSASCGKIEVTRKVGSETIATGTIEKPQRIKEAVRLLETVPRDGAEFVSFGEDVSQIIANFRCGRETVTVRFFSGQMQIPPRGAFLTQETPEQKLLFAMLSETVEPRWLPAGKCTKIVLGEGKAGKKKPARKGKVLNAKDIARVTELLEKISLEGDELIRMPSGATVLSAEFTCDKRKRTILFFNGKIQTPAKGAFHSATIPEQGQLHKLLQSYLK